MRVDPALAPYIDEARELLELLRAFPATDFGSTAAIEKVRTQLEDAREEPHLPVREVRTPGGVPIRIICPDRFDAVYLHMHAGGWIVGSARASDAANARLAAECGVAVASVEYRLAPEHPYPAALDDCVAAARWLAENAETEFGTDRLLVGGESSGATLAALTLLRLGPEARFSAANLAFGCYDMSITVPSQRHAVGTPLIDLNYLRTTRPLIFPGLDEEARRSPEISPLYAARPDLAGLPPALFSVGTEDPFLDDSLFMAARWEAAGNEARVDVYPFAPHVFTDMPTKMAAAAKDRIHAFVREHATSD
ncbi:alpha/beta hydrolase [Actinomadura spongiicola]|uniref:Alpha/beta hydrolase n=1 Tax=Actinomadura spongiicola TaxID=2303421 RepID=A0A372GMK7_9ACTN|nr:alpha/beta hydrolase [Actinomadura spongiicola]RFS86624.1 alpha/beta hydrolase [Actinomadura spongiicola]